MDTTLKSKKNKNLNESECYAIEALLKENFKEKEIAKHLDRHVSTIYLEIRQGTLELRNSDLIRKKYIAYNSLNIRQELMSNTGRNLLYS